MAETAVIDRVRDRLARTGIIPPGVRVLVGYSGGADSTCLLTVLHEIGVEVVAGHLHHSQREEADQELERCRAYAESLGVEFASGKADVPLIARQMKVGLEEAGRHARESFFRQATLGTSCQLIATGHTRTDRVETMLFHIARGTGLAGLASIPEERDGIVRPILTLDRADTESFCRERGLAFSSDPANSNVAFSRARIRQRVMPELRELNSALEEAAERLMNVARDEDRFLDGAAASALEAAEIPLNGPLRFLTDSDEAMFSRGVLGALPPVLLARALRLSARFVGAELDYRQSTLVKDWIEGSATGAVTAEGGEIVLELDADALHVRRMEATETYRHPLTVFGETAADAFGWSFLAAPPNTRLPESGVQATVLSGANLYFRSFANGDRIDARKVADIFAECRLTALARRRLPVVCDLIGPIWVPGGPVAERARGSAVLLWLGPIADASDIMGNDGPLRNVA